MLYLLALIAYLLFALPFAVCVGRFLAFGSGRSRR